MALRSGETIGVRDPRRIAPVLTEADPAPVPKRPPRTAAPAKARSKRRSGDADLRETSEHGGQTEPVLSLGDEPTDYLQVSVAEELQRRVELVSFEIAESHPRLAKHQLILGALLWRHVDYRDADKMSALAHLVARFEDSELAEVPLTRRLSARVPVSLKRAAKGAALRLRQTNEDASIRLVVSALVAEFVRGPEDARAYANLIECVQGYRGALRASHGA